MHKTPHANRVHIGIYGNRNAGKSSLFNAILGQNIALVSAEAGTTTDPVIKAMELIPFGPVVWLDTAGLDDEGMLGNLRVEKTKEMMQRTDFALYLMDAQSLDEASYQKTLMAFKKYNIKHLLVINKIDLIDEEIKEDIKRKYPDAIMISAHEISDVHGLNDRLQSALTALEEEPSLVGDLLPYNSTVVLVVPIDSEAPKGRIILPQVQIIRDCLDHGIKCHVVRDTELEMALTDLKQVDLVITDSQAFASVSKMVPQNIKLTSFSILFSRQKGDFDVFLQGAKALKQLKAGDKVLISESCTHNHSHEDIGRVKIPNLLKKHVSEDLEIDFSMGHDFPLDLSQYALVIHCGACMLNRKAMASRIQGTLEKEIPITNYGLVLAHYSGILDRSVEILYG